MSEDTIIEVGIDSSHSLYVKPSELSFPYIYREAMEVHWEPDKKFLYAPKPREWTYFDWFCQIIKAADAEGCFLSITAETKWFNISTDLQQQIQEWMTKR